MAGMKKRDLSEVAVDLVRGAALLGSGGCLIYPTETFYGLGAAMDDSEALARIIRLKGRPETKPLPLLVGEFEQIREVVSEEFFEGPLFEDFSRLAERFWPGSLSLVLPGREGLPESIRDKKGRTSVRLTPHPMAAELCRRAGTPLAATSANRSGRPPARDPADLDQELLVSVDGVVVEKPWPAGGAPSTVTVVCGGGRLVLVREGAVPRSDLEAAGFVIVSDEDCP
jgi:L-threonylcarbamoyladenylate synthase